MYICILALTYIHTHRINTRPCTGVYADAYTRTHHRPHSRDTDICTYTHIHVNYMSKNLWCGVLQCDSTRYGVLQCVAMCCSVLQCVAVCCSVMQCVAVCCSMLQFVVGLNLLQELCRQGVCCSVLQCD